MKMSALYIIRHGKTEMNRANLLQGRSDIPLNEEGILQAQEASDSLRDVHFDHVFSSPLSRALQTAKIVAPQSDPTVDERLIEMDYGQYEGTDLTQLPPELVFFFSDFVHNPAPEGMEQLSSVVERAGAFLEEIKNLEGNVLISTHAILMKGLLEYLTPGSNGSYWSRYIGNCAVYIAENKGGQYTVPHEYSL
jgi:broad specificity phosphatase PhoE